MVLKRVLVVGVSFIRLLAVVSDAAGQTASPVGPSPTAESRLAWTLIGSGLGLGGGLVSGVALFDGAIDSNRKVWTMAALGALGGGVIGNLSSRTGGNRTADTAVRDPLWNGMAIGAAAGAAVGLWYVPARHCKAVNPECPLLLRIGVGIPAVASGAALGAWIDRLFDRRGHGQALTAKTSRTFIMPVVAPGGVAVVYTRSFG